MKKFANTIAVLSIALAAASAQASLRTSEAVLAAQPAALSLLPSNRPTEEPIPANLQTAGAREVARCTGARVQRVAEATTGEYGVLGAPALYVWLLFMNGIGTSAAQCILEN